MPTAETGTHPRSCEDGDADAFPNGDPYLRACDMAMEMSLARAIADLEALYEADERGYPLVPMPTDEPDFGSEGWLQRHRHDTSRVNRLGWGCGIHDLLPAKGAWDCYYREHCEIANNPRVRHHCRRGWPCPREAEYYQTHVDAAHIEFKKARDWLSDEEFEESIRDLVLFDLRTMRCSARARFEGWLRKIRRKRKDGLTEELWVPALNDRYETAAFNGLMAAWEKLTTDPRDPADVPKPLEDWENVIRVQKLIWEARQAEAGEKTGPGNEDAGHDDEMGDVQS